MAYIKERQTKKGVSYLLQNIITDPLTGKNHYKSMTWKPEGLTAKQTQHELLLVEAKFDEECKKYSISSDPAMEKSKFTVYEYCVDWLENRQNELSPNTITHYENSIRYIAKYIGGVKLKKLTPYTIQQFYNKLDGLTMQVETALPRINIKNIMEQNNLSIYRLASNAGVAERTVKKVTLKEEIHLGQATKIANALGYDVKAIFTVKSTEVPYSYETINKVKRCFRAILATAKRQMLIADNYASADYITFPKKPSSEIDCMNEEECKLFYKALVNLDNKKVKTALMLSLLMGLRRGEVTGLEWSDLNFQTRELSVSRAYTNTRKYGPIIKAPKTRSSVRKATMPNILIEQLKAYKIEQDAERELLGDRWQNTNAVITGVDGKRIHPETLDKWLQDILKKAGLPKFTLHSLRHSNVTMQLMAGVPITIVANRVGHARVSTTLDMYSHFVQSYDVTAADKLDAMFG